MNGVADLFSSLSSEQRAAAEDRIEAFEIAWQRGERPMVADYLPDDPQLRAAVLIELVHIDSEFRRKSGISVRIESYVDEFPELARVKDLQPASTFLQHAGTKTWPANTHFDAMPTIPGYRIVREIGRGGMGVVFEARHLAREERFAVKVLTPTAQPTDQSTQLFLREASILSQLNHRFVVRFQEFGWKDGIVFIVMEYVDQVDLSALLAARPVDSRIRIVCGLMSQVLAALDFAHRRGLVHRDVKPNNVLVTKENGKLLTKLGDFGIAKNFETAGFSAMTADGEARGTFAYMAPEQLVDSRRAKPAADLFAVGVTLYHLLAGRLPYTCGRTPAGTISRSDKSPIPITEVMPDVPEALSQLLLRAMQTEPSRRFASAAEMKKALVPFVSSRRA
jgi:eukaryotic-like serine/threonine-protein kinase